MVRTRPRPSASTCPRCFLLLQRKRRSSTEDKRGFPQRRAIRFLALIFLLASRPAAEEAGEYLLDFLPDGSPHYTQVLRWDADPNVLYFEVTLQTGAGEDISVSKVAEPRLELNLSPGEYRYRIVLYNILRKPELELPWQEFSVLKAEFPRVARHEPKLWFVEDREASLTLWGKDLIPGARVVLKRKEAAADPVAASFRGDGD